MALLNFAATGTVSNPGPGDPYYVNSSPGELGKPGYIVYGTGTNNNNVVTNAAGMDNAFSTSGSGITSFDTAHAAEPTPTFSGDQTGTWDAQTSAIRSVLGSGQFAVFFNLNDTGNDNLQGGDLLAWAQVTIEGAGQTTKTYYLAGSQGDNMNGKNLSIANGAPDYQANPSGGYPNADNGVGDPNDPRWTYANNTLCAVQAAPNVPQFLHFGPCTASDPANAKNIDQSLGANAAAFAVYNQELSDAVMNPNSGYQTIHIRYIFGQENNGYEQLFNAQTQVGNQVPEPGMLGLLGIGLAGLPLVRRRRKSQ
ncbi:MAG TPA: PEP-CTERM sorting domain-containing protein [Accumulibacter sp.]|nr:PEP-CTERM sorting domain-containing protein [Accumulibacter sp.]HMY07197.1 PEP-CTERM sorting domain-containing protein [Accumulibacter sp.]HNC19144.1 PEP-CTERM sorting domain-containing protein [Accumulibacter sp.]HND81563.1 PEP-CTERM sorting domain-containing protein [Accumulibacter sp.]HNG39998.1 PEP-CTERM sorting domain-containing protein [Accumulibacter sp.]